MTHNLKTWKEYYQRIVSGEKTFEVRKNDRDFQTGDFLKLEEYDPTTDSFTGNSITKRVSYILHGGDFGVEQDTVVMALDSNLYAV